MSGPLRWLITGSRTCTDAQAALVVNALDQHAQAAYKNLRRIIVVHGRCPNGGVDLVAHRWAEQEQQAVPEPHPADWDRHGRAAGPIRNAAMVAAGADLCLAFPSPDSRGTWDCIRKAAAAGIRVDIYPLCAA